MALRIQRMKEFAVTHSYRIRRVEDDSAAGDFRSLLRSVFGHAPVVAPTPPRGIRYTAIAGDRMAGTIALQKPTGGQGDATVLSLELAPSADDAGCRDALLDVAAQWACAHGYSALTVTAPAQPASAVDAYLAYGFRIVGGQGGSGVQLRLPLAGACPHADTWYSKAHGEWFSEAAPH